MTIEEWLGNNELSLKIWHNKYQYNDETFDEWLNRVSGNNPKIRQLILDKKFLFGGRTIANRGLNNGSMSNCYSCGYVPDSLEGILDVNSKIALTFKAQGGQGVSLSKIRPKGTLIGKSFKSDGIVPFMEMFNTTTNSISQGGSRKGALMMSLDVWHPEIETFVTIKKDPNKINKANLSVEIDDSFMDAVEHNVNEEVKVHKEYSGKEINYTINPCKLYDLICESARTSAEPGILFVDRLRNYNIMQYVSDYQVETTNPCGEQPLAKHSACNLSSINISEYVKDPYTENACINYDLLKDDIRYIVEAMDDVLEENINKHPLKEQREMAEKYRNIGIGIMGLHDAFIKLGIVYGSEKSIKLAEKLMNFLFVNALYASVDLAEIRGNFPGYDAKVWDSDIIKYNLYPEEIDRLKKKGKLRNCSLLSIAPTGSIGTFFNISTGVEPWFALHYIRNTKSLDKGKDKSFEVWAPVAEEANKHNWHPETLITSNDISWKSHIDIQAAIQNSCDSAISKTINMSKDTSLQDVKDLYFYAWKKGLKGCTIYVDGSRDPILTTSTEPKKEEENKFFDTVIPISRKSMGVTQGCTFCKKCACGTLYITVNKDDKGNLVEVFTHTSKGGICQANLNAETRMVSLALRSGVKIDEVVDQLKGISCPACTAVKAKGKQLDGISCADIIARTIEEFQSNKHNKPKPRDVKEIPEFTECPECHEKTLLHGEGCVQCTSCGFSRCG